MCAFSHGRVILLALNCLQLQYMCCDGGKIDSSDTETLSSGRYHRLTAAPFKQKKQSHYPKDTNLFVLTHFNPKYSKPQLTDDFLGKRNVNNLLYKALTGTGSHRFWSQQPRLNRRTNLEQRKKNWIQGDRKLTVARFLSMQRMPLHSHQQSMSHQHSSNVWQGHLKVTTRTASPDSQSGVVHRQKTSIIEKVHQFLDSIHPNVSAKNLERTSDQDNITKSSESLSTTKLDNSKVDSFSAPLQHRDHPKPNSQSYLVVAENNISPSKGYVVNASMSNISRSKVLNHFDWKPYHSKRSLLDTKVQLLRDSFSRLSRSKRSLTKRITGHLQSTNVLGLSHAKRSLSKRITADHLQSSSKLGLSRAKRSLRKGITDHSLQSSSKQGLSHSKRSLPDEKSGDPAGSGGSRTNGVDNTKLSRGEILQHKLSKRRAKKLKSKTRLHNARKEEELVDPTVASGIPDSLPAQTKQSVSDARDATVSPPPPVLTTTNSTPVLGLDGKPLNLTFYIQFLKEKEFQRLLNREAQWAYVCLVAVILLMMFVLWYLGGLDHCRYRPDNIIRFTDATELMTVPEVVRRKRKYLPMFNEPDWEEVLMCNRATDP